MGVYVTIPGRVTRDAEVRDVGQSTVCSFGIATDVFAGKVKSTLFADCSIWGKRGESLSRFLTKGSSVTVVGELTTREHNGKTYLQVRVNDVALQGGGGGGRRSSGSMDGSASMDDDVPVDSLDDDNVPF